ncbi:MAG: inositol monophosphatase family protein, partial [Rhodospirillales bacterium]
RFGKLAQSDIREKKPGDLVTVADLAAEKSITAGLQKILPGIPVVGEEAVAADPALQEEIATAERAWIVDPLDGTSNFAKGRAMFAVIVALVERGRAIGGWIHDPINQRDAWVEHGHGAWLGDQRMQFTRSGTVKEMQGFVGFGFRRIVLEKMRPGALDQLGPITSLNCAGQEYIAMLGGERRFMLYRNVKPWDHAAGVLMMEEAGGYAARFDGTPYTPTTQDGGLLTAPDKTTWQQLHDIMLGDSLAEINAFPKR